MELLHLNRVVHFACRCEYCEEEAPAPWLILHKPGCPAGEEIESDEDSDDTEEEDPT